MKNNKILIFSIIILVVLNLFSLGMLWRTRHVTTTKMPDREVSAFTRGSRFLYKDLDFSDDQKKRVATIQRNHIAGMKELQHRHLKLRRTYLENALSPDYNTARGDSLIDQMAAVNAQMQKKTWHLFRSVYEVCTPSQQKKYRQLMIGLNRRHDKKRHPPVPFRQER